jgi:hypothetical protein
MSEPASAPGRVDMIGRILQYMDSPWKVGAIAVLGLLAGLGYLIWDQRERVAERFLTAQHTPPHLKSRETIGATLADVVQTDGTALAMVWSVDIRANAIRFVAAAAHDRKPWKPSDHDIPERLPAVTDTTSAASLVTLLHGEAQCMDTFRTVGLLSTNLLADGLTRLCLVPVPPAYGKVLGVLIMAWRAPEKPTTENAAVAEASEAAIHMVAR